LYYLKVSTGTKFISLYFILVC